MSFDEEIKDIRPNPGEKFSVIAILLVSGKVHVKDFLKNVQVGIIQSDKIGDRTTTICWSPKGKQLVCGNQAGKLMQYTPDGTSKATIQPPPDLQNPVYFADINLIARDESDNWASWIPSETDRAALPLSDIHDQDTLPIGIALDFTSTTPWTTRLDAEENVQIPPVPILYILNDECDIIGYHSFYKDAFIAKETTPGMLVPKVLPSSGHISEANLTKNTIQPRVENIPSIPPVKKDFFTPPAPVANEEKHNIINNKTPSIINAPPVLPTITKPVQNKITPFPSEIPRISSQIKLPQVSASPPPVISQIRAQQVGALPPPVISQSSQKPVSNQRLTKDESESKIPHAIRFNATKRAIEELHMRMEEVETKYISKYLARSSEQNFDDINSWTIGDFPTIISETKRLINEADYNVQALACLERQTSDLFHEVSQDVTKTKKEIEYLMYTPPNIIPVSRRGMLQTRIKDKLVSTFKTVKESVKDLEKQLNVLHEQIQEKKNRNVLRPSPLEYIDRSIHNISKSLYRNASQIDNLSAHLDKISLSMSIENESYNVEPSLVSGQIAKEAKSIMTPTRNINISYSVDAAKATATYLNKERLYEELKNLNKLKRKFPVKTNLFDEKTLEIGEKKPMSPIMISPKRSPSPVKVHGTPTHLREPEVTNTPGSFTKISSPLRKIISTSDQDLSSELFNNDISIRNINITKSSPEIEEGGILSPKIVGQSLEIGSDNSDYENELDETEHYEFPEEIKSGIPDKSNFPDNTSPRSDIEPRLNFGTSEIQNLNNVQISSNEKLIESLDMRNLGKSEDQDRDDDSIKNDFDRIVNTNTSRIPKTSVGFGLNSIITTPSDNFAADSFEPEEPSSQSTISPQHPAQELIQDEELRNSSAQNISQDSIDSKLSKSFSTDVSKFSRVSELSQYYEEVDEESNTDITPSERESFSVLSTENATVELSTDNNDENVQSTSETKGELDSSPRIEVKSAPDEEIVNLNAEATELSEMTESCSFELGKPLSTTSLSNQASGFGTFGAYSSSTSKPSLSNQTDGFGTFGAYSSSTNKPSFAFGAPSSPSPFGSGSTFGSSGDTSIPPAFATPPTAVNAFGQLPSGNLQQPPAFAQPSLGQSVTPNAFGQPAFGQTGFGQTPNSTFGQPAFGQPAFGQHGFGQRPAFGASASFGSSTLKPPSGGGFARFAR
ncbi:15546_t:CDS:2 [Acaulospora colombiana]|uniref:15546_t:CDS:1 n=1 Tax=Acaulospora colombiana TaxID=27376 RepID=A0ACA9LKE4_9GLOM|nr:15546_t:CDS:2 [Acaulospora colombiana]